MKKIRIFLGGLIILSIMIFYFSDKFIFFRKNQLIPTEKYQEILETYDKLQESLENKQYSSANELTKLIILNLTGANKTKTYISQNQIESLSCTHLQLIDEFWFKNSEGKYGLRIQKQIWVQDPENFAQNVGWLSENQETKGYFPIELLGFSSKKQIAQFFEQLENCEL